MEIVSIPDMGAFLALFVGGGVLAPFLTAIVNRPEWSENTRRGVSFLVSVVVAVVALALFGGLDLSDIPAAILAVLAVSTTVYAFLWKPTGVAGVIEARTSPASSTELDELNDVDFAPLEDAELAPELEDDTGAEPSPV